MEQNSYANGAAARPRKTGHRKTMKVGGVLAAIGAIASAVVGMLAPTGVYAIFGTFITMIIGLFSLLGATDFDSSVGSLLSPILSQPAILIVGILIHIVLLAVMIAACVFVILMLKKKNENSKKSVIIGLVSTIVILVAPYIASAIMSILVFILDTQGLTDGLGIFAFMFAMEIGVASMYWILGGLFWVGFLIAGFIIRFLWVGKWAKLESGN